MSITKPFTFVAGTKARANEVNADFDTLYTQVNSNISAINTNANDIDNLESNKANINGSTSQVFKVADPVVAMDAVNKQSMMGAINNTINYIDGYTIAKDSGSPEDTILVTAGSCYDYTKTVVLAKDISTTKQNTSQGASTTYYVYVIGNDSGSSVDILISSSAVTPALPEGYTKFRQIGSYTTDSNSHILSINYYSNSNFNLINIAPDYSRAVSFNPTSGDALDFDGWLLCNPVVSGAGVIGYVSINDIVVSRGYADAQLGGEYFNFMSIVKNGDVIKYSGINGSSSKFYKVPFVGGSL